MAQIKYSVSSINPKALSCSYVTFHCFRIYPIRIIVACWQNERLNPVLFFVSAARFACKTTQIELRGLATSNPVMAWIKKSLLRALTTPTVGRFIQSTNPSSESFLRKVICSRADSTHGRIVGRIGWDGLTDHTLRLLSTYLLTKSQESSCLRWI